MIPLFEALSVSFDQVPLIASKISLIKGLILDFLHFLPGGGVNFGGGAKVVVFEPPPNYRLLFLLEKCPS